MGRVETMVQLTDDLVRLLDAEAARRGVSRSALIREALTANLAEARDAELSRQIVEGYRQIPPGTPDEWGDPEAMADIAAEETLQRLEEEERQAGFKPW